MFADISKHRLVVYSQASKSSSSLEGTTVPSVIIAPWHKVETVGDSYVAVCGLPPDHALIMARFAGIAR
jgi:hypothetical protein